MSEDSGKIAVIGMSGAFPGARTVDELWHCLCQGKEMVRCLDKNTTEDDASAGERFVPAVACMDGIELFDSSFFGMPPAEADWTDPQHRILLEHAWSALENAGYAPKQLSEPVGVFAGATINSYLLRNLASRPDLMCSADPIQLNIGNGLDFLTTRISYKLNLRGPSHAVQSACSTSLLAIHCAARSLFDFECDMALAGGVSINVSLLQGYRYREGGIFSPDGHCRPFDADAQGTIFGAGVGIVVLKRLDDARAQGDSIHAVILGSAVNNDGVEKVGFTAPSVEGQSQVIIEAMGNAGVEPGDLSFVECHGTATPMGDPIEVNALARAFGRSSKTCALGSIKSNVGHLDAAAGVTSFIKAVLSLREGVFPPTIHFRRPNPQIQFQGTPFYVNTSLQPLPSNGKPVRGAVSAFGVGGTNVHMVLEEPPRLSAAPSNRAQQLLLLSAKTGPALIAMKRNLAAHLLQHPEMELADVAYTLQMGREHFAFSDAFICEKRETAIAALQQDRPVGPFTSRALSVVFLFPGQGAQQLDMGRELYRHEPVFRQSIEHCAEILLPLLGLDLRAIMRHGVSGDMDAGQTDETWFVQPVLFSVEYSLAKLWTSWGVRPQAMLGHSLGEYTAACLSGVMSLEDTLRITAIRGKLMQQTPLGAMLAVGLPAAEALARSAGEIEVAAENAADFCTVAGTPEAIGKLEEQLKRERITCHRLRTSRGFHSRLVEAAQEPFREEVVKIPLNPPSIPFISNVTGRWITGAQAQNPEYWVSQMRHPILFSTGLQHLFEEPGRMFLEIGPGQVLRQLVLRHSGVNPDLVVASMPKPGIPESEGVLAALGHMWQAGIGIDWKMVHGSPRRRVPLPTYPFERRRHWIEAIKHDWPSQMDPSVPGPSVYESQRPAEQENTRPVLSNDYHPPENDTERTIVAILEKTLGVHPIGITDKFAELGGDSLAAIRIVEEINHALRSDLHVVDLYEGLTTKELADHLGSAREETSPAMTPADFINPPTQQRRREYLHRRQKAACENVD